MAEDDGGEVPSNDELHSQGPVVKSDPALNGLVAAINAAGALTGSRASTSVTLLVSGRMLRCQLVDGASWWSELSTELIEAADANQDDGSPLLKGIGESYAEVATKGYGKEATVSSDNPIAYLHLKNVEIYPGGSLMDRMRLRITEVQGWQWGHTIRE